jgi:outer membrane biosynthesis protein TonB
MSSGKPTHILKDYDHIGLGISLLLHVIVFWIVFNTKPLPPPLPTTINVTIEPASTLTPKRQIVSPSLPSIKPPENTDKISDVDSRTDVEKIRRDDPGGAPGKPAQQAQPKQSQEQQKPSVAKPEPPQKQAPKTTEKQNEKVPQKTSEPQPKRDLHLSDLKLDSATLTSKFGNNPQNPSKPKSSSASTSDLSQYQAFSRPPGSGAAFVGTGGINDHLPNLPDGDITLLNAKANQYAGFVRRVAVQVFTQLRTQGWERISAQQLHQLGDFTTIEAVLTAEGKFIRATIIGRSGSDAFDGVVNTSVTQGASDPNPPEGARAKDGLIHFIFRARSWSQMGFNRRSGAPTENRWLLLATGLE